MAITERTIDVAPGSELDRLLAEANGASLVLVRDGVRFRVEREDAKPDIWANHDSERLRQVLRETAGAWKDVDREAFKAEIRRWRGHEDDDFATEK